MHLRSVEMATVADPLLLPLYGACTESKRWRDALDVLCTETGARSAALQAIRLQGSQVRVYWTAHDSWLGRFSYDAFISDLTNPRLQADRLRRAAGGLVSDEDLFSDAEAPLARRLHSQLVDLGLGRFLGGLIPLGHDRFVAIALHRNVGDAIDFSARQRDRIASLLLYFQ